MRPENALRAPTHYTSKMARAVLKLGKSRINELMEIGGELQPEVWYGQRLIPAYKIMLAKLKRGL